MKRRILILFCLFSCLLNAQKTAEPAKAEYLFFLHNKFLEDQGLESVHPEYGKVEYREAIRIFQQQHFKVISEIRPKETDVKLYALKITKQIDSLLKMGVKSSHITVIGTSKGGYIAMNVSGLLKNPAVNFVFIGCCSAAEASAVPEFNFCGNILSIYEKSDVVGRSCESLKNKSSNKVSRFKEIELNTGLKHGFLFKASREWIDPSIQWARQGG